VTRPSGCTWWGVGIALVLVMAPPLHADVVSTTDDAATPAGEAQPTPSVAAAPGGIGTWVSDRTLALHPVRPAWSLDFPLEFGRHLVWDTAYLLTAPTRWDGCDWGKFSLFAAAFGGTLGLDEPIDHWSRVSDPRSNTEADIEDAIQKFGEVIGVTSVLGGGYLYGLVTGSEEMQSKPFTLGEALVITSLVFVEPLKAITGRERPNTGNGPYDWFAGGKSFPSGHTATAFSLAAGVSEYADNNLWVAVPAYALATAVGYSRIRANAHFLSDVFVGGTIGVVTTKTVFELERERTARETAGLQVSLAPFTTGTVHGLEIIGRF
jgi:membrane-associated phospholipid phosphatase